MIKNVYKNTMKYEIRLKAHPKEVLIKKPLYKDKYISTKTKIYNGTIHTEFKHKKILKDKKHCNCIPIKPQDGNCYARLSTILLDSILVNSNNKHYRQIFLEKCLYVVNKKVLLGKYIDKSNS